MAENVYLCSMKFLWTRLVCLTLALTILVGSIGMAATRHICLVSRMAMTKASEEKKDSCCPDEKESTATEKPTFEKRCCELSVSHFKLQAETNNIFSAVKLPLSLTYPVSLQLIPDWLRIVIPQKLFVSYFNKAPPLAGRALLSFIRILII